LGRLSDRSAKSVTSLNPRSWSILFFPRKFGIYYHGDMIAAVS
jgi:hypothetical protein